MVNFAIYENGVRLTRASSQANADATAGSFYCPLEGSLTSGTPFTIYCHASDNGNPFSNGKTYEVTAREQGIVLGDASHANARIENIECRRGGHTNGPLQIGISGVAAGCVVRYGADKGFNLNGGTCFACQAIDGEFGNDFYLNSTQATTLLENCSVSLGATSAAISAAGFSIVGGSSGTVTLRNCSCTSHQTAYSVGVTTGTVNISNCYAHCRSSVTSFKALAIVSSAIPTTVTIDHLRAEGNGSLYYDAHNNSGSTVPATTLTNCSFIESGNDNGILVDEGACSVSTSSLVSSASGDGITFANHAALTLNRCIVDGFALGINGTGASVTYTGNNNVWHGNASGWVFTDIACANLATFQSTTSQDANSLSADPVWKHSPITVGRYFGYTTASPAFTLHAGYPEFGTWQPWSHAAETALESAVSLNQQGRAFARTGTAFDPFYSRTLAGGVARQRQMATPFGTTFTADLIEASSANLASGLSTATYAAAVSATHVAWWDGGASDYVITASVGTPTIQNDLADGRHWVQITGVTSSSTITCTRAGGATNSHLQVEANYHPTTKVALSGSRGADALTWSYGSLSTSAGTIVYIVRPEGWDEFPRTSVYRHSGARPLVESVYSDPSTKFALNDNGGTQQNAFAPFYGYDERTAWYTGTWDSTKLKAFTDGYTAGNNVPRTTFTFPWQVPTSGNIGAAGGGSTPDDSYILMLSFGSVLPDATIADIPQCLGFDDLLKPRISCWGDSLTYGDLRVSWVYTMEQLRRGNRVYNGGTNSESSTAIKNRFVAAPEKWGDISLIWAGRNDYSSPSTVMANIATMVGDLTTNKYVIFTVTNDSTQPIGSAGYNQVATLNALINATYGRHVFDVRSFWISQYNPGIPQDVTDHGNDVPPSSLRYDTVHPNIAGDVLIGQRVAQFITAQGW